MSLEEALYGSLKKLFMALALILDISPAGAVVSGAARYAAVSSVAVLAAMTGFLAPQPRITPLAGDLARV